MKKLFFLYIIFLFGTFSPLYALVDNAQDTVHLQLRWHHQFQFAGYYAALKQGYYAEKGLNVIVHEGDPHHQPVSEILAGRVQYAIGNSEVLYRRLKGEPLVALAVIFQHSASVLLVRGDSGITLPYDLLGKKMMLMDGTDDPEFLVMLRNEGIDPKNVEIIPSSYQINDLIEHKVDVFNAYSTNEPFLLQEQNISYKIINPNYYNVDFYSDILFTSETELEEHSDRVVAMRSATLKGWKYAMTYPDEMIDWILASYPVEKSREHLKFEATKMQNLILPELINIGHMNPSRWKQMADTFVRSGLIKSGYSLEGFIFSSLPKTYPRKLVFGVIALLFFLLAIVLLWNTLLQKQVKKQVEKITEQTTRLVQKSRDEQMGTMIASISHQWREPLSSLSAINLFTMETLNSQQKISSKTLRQQCQQVEETIDFMSLTMQNFLEFYKTSDVKTSVDLCDSVKDILMIIETKIIDNNIEIELICKETVEKLGIKNEWMQIWLNLINNSIEAFIEKKIENPKIRIEITSHGIIFSDNAGGMDFNGPHHGLGLSICKEIAKKYGTELSLENKLNGLCARVKFIV